MIRAPCSDMSSAACIAFYAKRGGVVLDMCDIGKLKVTCFSSPAYTVFVC